MSTAKQISSSFSVVAPHFDTLEHKATTYERLVHSGLSVFLLR